MKDKRNFVSCMLLLIGAMSAVGHIESMGDICMDCEWEDRQ